MQFFVLSRYKSSRGELAKFKQALLSAVEKNAPSRHAGTGTHKSRPPELLNSLLILSRKPSTNSQMILLMIAEPCHSSSNG